MCNTRLSSSISQSPFTGLFHEFSVFAVLFNEQSVQRGSQSEVVNEPCLVQPNQSKCYFQNAITCFPLLYAQSQLRLFNITGSLSWSS
jgi:hypothetical protein